MAEPRTRAADTLSDLAVTFRRGLEVLFTIWRALLTAVVRRTTMALTALRTTLGRTAGKFVMVSTYLTGTAAAWADPDDTVRSAAATFGITSLVAGLVMGAALAARGSAGPESIALILLTEILWAAVRYLILALLTPVRFASRRDLVTVYLAGLIPYSLGLTPALRVASLAWSAFLTERGLRGAGVPDRVRRTGMLWSFGGHAAALLAGVLGRGALVVLLGLG